MSPSGKKPVKSPKTPRATAASTTRVHWETHGSSPEHTASVPITQGQPKPATVAPANSEGGDSHHEGSHDNSGFALYTSTNPAQSLNPGTFYHPSVNQPPHQQFVAQNPAFPVTICNPHPFPPLSTPLIYHYPAPAPMDYQNAGPRPDGQNFQPPVPDSTYGPMTHIYQPRFDNGFVPAWPQQIPGNNVTVVGQTSYPGANGYVIAQQPGFAHGNPYPVQVQHAGYQTTPGFLNSQPIMQPPQPAMGMAYCAGPQSLPPDITGYGRTGGEVAMEQAQFAYENNMYAPQDFKPSDDDPSRIYPVRELDGAWTHRSRFTIDNLGDCRWFITDSGYFYATRLPN